MNIVNSGGAAIVFGAILALVMVSIIITLLSKRQLGEKYAVLWLVIGITGLVVIAVPGLLGLLTRALNVQLPSNLLFGGTILLLVGVSLHLSWELSRAESEIRRLAEDSAINALEIEKLSQRIRSIEGAFDASEPTRADSPPTPNDVNPNSP